jgi:hypothetical protein
MLLAVCLRIYKPLSDELKVILVSFQTRGNSVESVASATNPSVRNFVEMLCAIKSDCEVGEMGDMSRITPLFSKGGLKAGSLCQSYPLAASEQFILNPDKVHINVLM